MSKIGKKPIIISQGVSIEIKGNDVTAKGPLGQINQALPEELLLEQKENQLLLSVKKENKKAAALWGLHRALLQNIIIGVSEGFEKKLEIIGVGYKANVEGDKIVNLSLGFSHPVKMEIPQGLKVIVEKNIITISGISKQEVGQFAAEIREKRKPEPYKGKGVRYVGEKVRRKEGKKAATAAS